MVTLQGTTDRYAYRPLTDEQREVLRARRRKGSTYNRGPVDVGTAIVYLTIRYGASMRRLATATAAGEWAVADYHERCGNRQFAAISRLVLRM
jgi:hypothetical protein